jgi:hypothetical protein
MGTGNVTPEVVRQRNLVEELVARHGFTCAGHPKNQAVIPLRMFDELFAEEHIVELRRCEVEARAYSYHVEANGSVVFLFRADRAPRRAHLAGLTKVGGLWLNESYTEVKMPGFRRLPSI